MSQRPHYDWIGGALAGLIATLPMTLFLIDQHRRLPPLQRYRLPPRVITDQAARRVGIRAPASESGKRARALAAHFTFGALCGLFFPAWGRNLNGVRSVAAGAYYGLGIWALSYLGWVPAMGLMAPATRQPVERNAMMIVAHLIWGATLAAAFQHLRGTPGVGSEAAMKSWDYER